MQISVEIMEHLGVSADSVRAMEHDLAPGVDPGMTRHGWETDEWPASG